MMYRFMDAENNWLSVYFVLVIFVMNFWILNLIVAVVSEALAKIKDGISNTPASKSKEIHCGDTVTVKDIVNSMGTNDGRNGMHGAGGTEHSKGTEE